MFIYPVDVWNYKNVVKNDEIVGWTPHQYWYIAISEYQYCDSDKTRKNVLLLW